MRTRLPASSAFATATTIPRSLNEPVGFRPSYLKNSRFRPSERAMLRLGTNRRGAFVEVDVRRVRPDRQVLAVAGEDAH